MEYRKRQAPSALKGVTKLDLRELCALANPPQDVKKLVCATCLLLGYPPSMANDWAKQRAVIASIFRNGATIPFSISPQSFNMVKQLVWNMNSVHAMNGVSRPLVNLFIWVKSRLWDLEKQRVQLSSYGI